jgi:hypothetical protein
MLRRATALLALSLTACGTVTHGPLQRIQVESEPAGARVNADHCGSPKSGQLYTPATVWVSRRATRCKLTLRLDGFEQRSVMLHRRLSDKFAENTTPARDICAPGLECGLTEFLVTGLMAGLAIGTGFAVDSVSGAMYEQRPYVVAIDFTDPETWRTEPEAPAAQPQ